MQNISFYCDISGSVNNKNIYHTKILEILDNYALFNIKTFEWNSNCSHIEKKDFILNREKLKGFAGTNPISIVKYLPTDLNSLIYITTDGEIDSSLSLKLFNLLKLENSKFKHIIFHIIPTGGNIDLTCGLAFRDYCETFELISPYYNISLNDTLLNNEILSINTIEIFNEKYDNILKQITLKCQGIKTENNILKNNLLELKKKLSIYLNRNIHIDEFNELMSFENITLFTKKIHDSHYNGDITYGSKLERLLNIVNGSLVNNYSLFVSHNNIIGNSINSSNNIEIEELIEIDFDISLSKFLKECDILGCLSINCIPLKKKFFTKFLPDGNQSEFVKNPLTLLNQELPNPFLGNLSLEYLKLKYSNDHPYSREEFFEGYLILPNISLGESIMKKAIKYNNKVLQKYITNKQIGNPNLIFIVFYFLALKQNFLNESMIEFTQQLKYRMNNCYDFASLLGSTPNFPNKKLLLIQAFIFVIESSRTSLNNLQNPFFAHISYSNYIIDIIKICGYEIDPLIIKYITAIKCYFKILKIFKIYQGKKNPLIYLLRCYYQKILEFQSEEILCNIIPLDGYPTNESQIIVMNKINDFLNIKDLSIDEIIYLVQLIEPNLNSFVSNSITIQDINYSNFIEYKNKIIKNIQNWKITNYSNEELCVNIDINTGKPFECDKSILIEKWGNKYLSCTKNFQELTVKLDRFPTNKELIIYVYKSNIRYLTLPFQFEKYCSTTIVDYLKLYDNSNEFLDVYSQF